MPTLNNVFTPVSSASYSANQTSVNQLPALSRVENIARLLHITDENKTNEFKGLAAWLMYAEDTYKGGTTPFDSNHPRPQIDRQAVVRYLNELVSPEARAVTVHTEALIEFYNFVETASGAWSEFESADVLRSCTAQTFSKFPRSIQEMIFSTVNLKAATIKNVNLQGIELCMPLCEIEFQGVDLNGAILSTSVITECEFRGGDLSGANFSEANLDSNIFRSVVLTNTNFESTKLDSCQFSGIGSMGNVNFSNSRLVDTMFTMCEAESSQFTGVVTESCLFGDINFNNSNFSGARFNDCKFGQVTFQQADLTNATLTNLRMPNVDFKGAVLDGATLQLRDNIFTETNSAGMQAEFDQQLNHRNNGGRSLLKSVDSIDDKYASIKIGLIESIVNEVTSAFDTVSDSETLLSNSNLCLAFSDVLLSSSIYDNSTPIQAFIDDYLLPSLEQYGNNHIIRPEDVSLTMLLTLKNKMQQALSEPAFEAKCSAFVNQIFSLCDHQERVASAEIAASLHELRDTWHSHLTIQPFYEVFKNTMGSTTGIFLFNKDEVSDKEQVLAYESEEFAQLLSGNINDTEPKWNNVLYFERDNEAHSYEIKGVANLSTLLAPHPLMASLFNAEQSRVVMPALIKTTVAEGEYQQRFLAAVRSHHANGDADKLTSPEHQLALGAIFSPYLNEHLELQPEHIDTLWQAYLDTLAQPITQVNEGSQKAALMLSMATVYTYLSSIYHFGEEEESPQIIRNYAKALLNEAHRLDPHCVDALTLEEWNGRLIPSGSAAHSCTALLTDDMRLHIEDGPSNTLFSSIFPPAWR